MDDGFEHFPAPVRWLLRSNFSTGAVLLGPLWLLWHGAWRITLRYYLPLLLADAFSFWLVGFGMAHHSRLWIDVGT